MGWAFVALACGFAEMPVVTLGHGAPLVAAFGTEQAAAGAGAVGRDVLAEQGDELRGDRDFAGGPAGVRVGPAFGAAFEAAVQTGWHAHTDPCLPLRRTWLRGPTGRLS